MRHLKLFENNTLDNILDKISDNGMDSLTDLEREFLKKYNSGNYQDVEDKLTGKNNQKSLSGIDKDYTDVETADNKYAELWNLLYDEDMAVFTNTYRLPYDITEKPWNSLPKYVHGYFIEYVKEAGLLD